MHRVTKDYAAAAGTELPHRADGGRGDAPPTNRASHTCKDGGGFTALRWGGWTVSISPIPAVCTSLFRPN